MGTRLGSGGMVRSGWGLLFHMGVACRSCHRWLRSARRASSLRRLVLEYSSDWCFRGVMCGSRIVGWW
eukprot:416590-Alexandrium_andersonii.AAC.1